MQGCRLVCSVLIEGNFTNYLLIQCNDFSYASFIQNKICAFKILIDGSQNEGIGGYKQILSHSYQQFKSTLSFWGPKETICLEAYMKWVDDLKYNP